MPCLFVGTVYILVYLILIVLRNSWPFNLLFVLIWKSSKRSGWISWWGRWVVAAGIGGTGHTGRPGSNLEWEHWEAHCSLYHHSWHTHSGQSTDPSSHLNWVQHSWIICFYITVTTKKCIIICCYNLFHSFIENFTLTGWTPPSAMWGHFR